MPRYHISKPFFKIKGRVNRGEEKKCPNINLLQSSNVIVPSKSVKKMALELALRYGSLPSIGSKFWLIFGVIVYFSNKET